LPAGPYLLVDDPALSFGFSGGGIGMVPTPALPALLLAGSLAARVGACRRAV
jgi:hypothetical protein